MNWENLFLLVAAFFVLKNALLFYGSLRLQTEHVSLWFEPDSFTSFAEETVRSRWSAPLDDVFIHFDFARATARGYPFQWVEGNGYSSGGTSLLYPFVLAAGWLLGFEGLRLAHFAALVACVSTFAYLMASRVMFRQLPGWMMLLAPAALLSVGALNWTLFSGMEVALFLALWGLAAVVWSQLLDAISAKKATRQQALVLGLCCGLLVATRPEAAPLVALFGIWCAIALLKNQGIKAALLSLLLIGGPGACILVAHMAANHALTGNSAAAGALAKLEMHHPYMTSGQVFGSWVFFMKYQFLRLSDYHFAAPIGGWYGSGFLIWPLALLSAVFDKTRRYGILLLTSVLIWFALVALNGQVRWQNERYTMPAVAWLLLAAALGVAASGDWLLRHWKQAQKGDWRGHSLRTLGTLAVVGSVLLLLLGQAPRFSSQVWFFGRASRNILEQHVRAGSALGETNPRLHRILLSDAGALPYVSDLSAFDLIGLGGYEGLPIARASRQGVGAAVELLAHMPLSELPDVMALYPSWWGDFVVWFGRPIQEFPVRGNVICGGASKVIYAPQWAPLLLSNQPQKLRPQQRVIDSIDIADLISESRHQVDWDRPTQGYVGMKLLPHLRDPHRDLWDAGRLLSPGMTLRFTTSASTKQTTHLLIRAAPAADVRLHVSSASGWKRSLSVKGGDHWQEISLPLGHLRQGETFSLRPDEGELHLHHIFVIEDRPTDEAAGGQRAEARNPSADDLPDKGDTP